MYHCVFFMIFYDDMMLLFETSDCSSEQSNINIYHQYNPPINHR